MKIVERILCNQEYCEKVAQMSVEAFENELEKRGLSISDVAGAYKLIKTTAARGELSNEELEAVTGGYIASGEGKC